jgi:hypothetical protein
MRADGVGNERDMCNSFQLEGRHNNSTAKSGSALGRVVDVADRDIGRPVRGDATRNRRGAELVERSDILAAVTEVQEDAAVGGPGVCRPTEQAIVEAHGRAGVARSKIKQQNFPGSELRTGASLRSLFAGDSWAIPAAIPAGAGQQSSPISRSAEAAQTTIRRD